MSSQEIGSDGGRSADAPAARKPHGGMRLLNADDVAHLAAAIEPQYSALVFAAAYTGCRFGELAALRVHNLDLLRRNLTVAEKLSDVRGQLALSPVKAPAHRRIALPRFLVDELRKHFALWPPGPGGSVFTAPQGGRLRSSNFRIRAWVPAVRASVGEPLGFRDLRHTQAAILISQGEHPKTIQLRLGHPSLQVTLDTYGHLFEGLDEAAADRLDAAFLRTPADSSRTLGDSSVSELPNR